MTNDRRAGGKGPGNRQHRQFIDELRHFLALNDRALERCTRDLDNSTRLELIDIFDCFTHLRTHAHEHTEHGGARIVESDVAHKQMRSEEHTSELQSLAYL